VDSLNSVALENFPGPVQLFHSASVSAAPANCRLKPEPEPALILAEPSCRRSSCHFSRLPLSRLMAR
jgi:hypothetical protein